MFSVGSIRLFEIAGTTIRVHLTFFLLLAWLGVAFWIQGGPVAAFYGVAFILVLFACVVLHEFGHIIAARRYGIRTPDVTLLPIGGVASLERMPREPEREIFVAIAGPLVNLVIAGVIILLIGGDIRFPKEATGAEFSDNFVSQIAFANLILFGFNLIPAFPMDGGRIFRALLTFFMGYQSATQMAAKVGQFLAIVFGVLGLMGNPILIFIALFIFLAATGEAGQAALQAAIAGRPARDLVITKFETLGPDADLDTAVEKLLRTTQQEFPVTDETGRFLGVMTRARLVRDYHARGGQTPVVEVMQVSVPVIDERTTADHAVELLQKSNSGIVVVLDPDKKLVGYINTENLSELFMVSSNTDRPWRATGSGQSEGRHYT